MWPTTDRGEGGGGGGGGGFSLKLDRVVENHSEGTKNHSEGAKNHSEGTTNNHRESMWYFEHHSEDFFLGEPCYIQVSVTWLALL